jgi:hypothetical protein
VHSVEAERGKIDDDPHSGNEGTTISPPAGTGRITGSNFFEHPQRGKEPDSLDKEKICAAQLIGRERVADDRRVR